MFFTVSSRLLALILFAIMLGAAALGLTIGHAIRHHAETISEPFAVLQGAMLGVVGLILAFGLSLAVGRYENRRAAVVEEANAIGTTYLRAQTPREPVRTGSLVRLRSYADTSVRLATAIPGRSSARQAAATGAHLQRERLIKVPAKPLVDERAAMALPPAASGSEGP